jgi:hypothetical protein
LRIGKDQRLSLEQSQRITRARTMGLTTALPIFLEDSELALVVSVILSDVGNPQEGIHQGSSYYDLPLSWFQAAPTEHIDFVELYLQSIDKVQDFDTYFGCLCDIHKRRRKYEHILSAQPLPTMAQVSPRALLEFGIIASPALASWITWRKWFYDIDNRAAQETGYLFEPILAASLGGESYGAGNSPIRRRADAKKGRQVDCVVGKIAYEFKLRVTIAASGQGRFAEELEFAKDCEAAGYTPVLLVLDPTPSSRLTELSAEFSRVGGEAYIGDQAWAHIEKQAGPTMATFVEKYVRGPIAEIDSHSAELMTLAIQSLPEESSFRIHLEGKTGTFKWDVKRHDDPALSDDEESEGVE